MRKILISLLLTLFVTGCAETMALLGPASTSIGGGNVAQSAVSTTVNYGVKNKQVKVQWNMQLPMQKNIIQKEKK